MEYLRLIQTFLKNKLEKEEYPSSFFQMLDQIMPVYASEADRQGVDPWTELNRHVILHGESVDYGTQLNSAKALSLLSFVSQLRG